MWFLNVLASGIIKQSCLINFKCSVLAKTVQNHRKHKEAGTNHRNMALLKGKSQRSPLSHGEAERKHEHGFCMKDRGVIAFIGDKHERLAIAGSIVKIKTNI